MNTKVFQYLLLSLKCAIVVVSGASLLACEKDMHDTPIDMHDTPIDIRDVTISSVEIYKDHDVLNPFELSKSIIGKINCSVVVEYLTCHSDDPSVIVFRGIKGIPNIYKENNVRIGNAYMWRENELHYIKTIDLSLSNLQIAESFGIHPTNTKEIDIGSYARGKAIDKKTGKAKNMVVVPDLNRAIIVGENWRGEGVFVR